MILISRGQLIYIARFCNVKKLLGYGRIRVHKNITKTQIIEDMRRFFQVISLSKSFRLVPRPLYQPILPEILWTPLEGFHLNGKQTQDLFEWNPYFSS